MYLLRWMRLCASECDLVCSYTPPFAEFHDTVMHNAPCLEPDVAHFIATNTATNLQMDTVSASGSSTSNKLPTCTRI
jgi:hypothetical protein